MRFARRQYLTRSGAALGGVLGAACSLTESLWPDAGPPPRRVPPGHPPRAVRAVRAGGWGPRSPKFLWTGQGLMGDRKSLSQSGSARPLPPP